MVPLDPTFEFLLTLLPVAAAPLGLGGLFFAVLALCSQLADQPPRGDAQGLATVGFFSSATLLVWWMVLVVQITNGEGIASVLALLPGEIQDSVAKYLVPWTRWQFHCGVAGLLLSCSELGYFFWIRRSQASAGPATLADTTANQATADDPEDD